MKSAEHIMLELLKELKNNYFVSALKLEFEAEGTSFEEAVYLKKLTNKANLDLTVKTGGCEALRDIFDCKKLNVKTIIAPMIETPYALSKFVKSVDAADLKEAKLYINIETKTSIENLNNIIEESSFGKIDGIVLGRSDLICSMGINKREINSDKIFEIAKKISEKMKILNKDFIIGGGICPKSTSFLSSLPYLTGFETRKIVFRKDVLSDIKTAKTAIKKALEFETQWLDFKKTKWGFSNKKDIERLKKFEKIIK